MKYEGGFDGWVEGIHDTRNLTDLTVINHPWIIIVRNDGREYVEGCWSRHSARKRIRILRMIAELDKNETKDRALWVKSVLGPQSDDVLRWLCR